MAWINISIRGDGNILVTTAAATQTFDHTRSLLQIDHEMEEIQESTVLLKFHQTVCQLIILLADTIQIFLRDRILHFRILHNRLHRDLIKALLIQMEYILGKIQIVLCICSTDIPFLIATLLHKFFKIPDDAVIASCSVCTHTHPVIDFLSSINGKNNIIHFLVDEINRIIIQKHTVCCDRKTEMLAVFLLLASGVSYGLLYYIEIHQRLTTEEIKLEILSSDRLLQKKINGCLSGFQRHQLTSRTKIPRGCKAILAAQITVMGNMKAHCLNR